MSKGKLFLIPVSLHEHTWPSVLPASVPEVIKNTHFYIVENTRTARRFIASLQTGISIDTLTFWEHTAETPIENLDAAFEHLLAGENVGVMSEAGCPGVADPGAKAVQKAHQLGIEVVPMVGPSSILLALMASGLNGQCFAFQGYLPISKEGRIKALKNVEKIAVETGQTQIFIETPYRNHALMADIIQNCKPNTLLCVACELTAPTQFIKTLPVKAWKGILLEMHKKPAIFLLGVG